MTIWVSSARRRAQKVLRILTLAQHFDGARIRVIHNGECSRYAVKQMLGIFGIWPT